MFLTPHHFQQWDRYYDRLLSERFRLTSPFGWGCVELTIDTDGLSNGTFSLLRLCGIMPDGLIINMPDEDLSPQSRVVGESFEVTMDHLDVYIGIAADKSGSANISMDDGKESSVEGRAMRYAMKTSDFVDNTTGENRREVSVAGKSFKLFFSGEQMSDYTTLKIAEVIRTPGGSLVLRESYVPPCMTIAASPYLVNLARNLLDILKAKSSMLEGICRDVAESAKADAVKLSLLRTVNATIPQLAHICRQTSIDPERLYLIVSQLAGELASYSPKVKVGDIPAYHHSDLSPVFSSLEKMIRFVVEGVSETETVSIPLEEIRPHIWLGRTTDDRLFETSRFYLVVSGDLPDNELSDIVPVRFKAGASEDLELIINAAMPGVRLYHNPRPPSSIPIKEGHQYFRLDDQGSFWEAVLRSRSIAFYVPADLAGLGIQLIAAKE